MFGVTMEGNSVCAHVHGFSPYFYIAAPSESFTAQDCSAFYERLEEALQGKYTLRAPVAPISTTTVRGHTVYDTPRPTSKCQIELDISWEEFISHLPEGEWQKMAPVRILSFNIECAGRKGVFPEPEKDPVIQIHVANMVVSQGRREPFIRNVFTLGQCAPIVGSDVVCFDKGENLLEVSELLDVMGLFLWTFAFLCRLVQEVYPDIITGYNIMNFDLPYLLNRSRTLHVKDFPHLGRIIGGFTTMKDSTFESKSYGKRVNKLISIEGRVQFDLLQVLLRDTKLRSYSLNSVSYHFLQEQKEDVHHSIITDLQDTSFSQRGMVASSHQADDVKHFRKSRIV
eukprot:Em1255g1a